MQIKNTYLLIIFLLSIHSKNAFTQTNVDSLESEFKKQTDPKIKSEIAASLIFETYKTLGDLKKSDFYFKYAIANADRKAKGRNFYADALRSKGIIHYYTNNHDSAFIYFNRSLEVAIDREDHYSECKAYNNIASAHYTKGDIKKALEFYILGAGKEKEYGYPEGEHISLNNIGYIYVSLKMYEKARDYFRKTINQTKLNKRNTLIYSYDGLSTTFSNNRDSANFYKFKSYNLAVELNDLNSVMYASNDIANYYLEKKDYSKAIRYAKECLVISDSLQNQALRAYAYNVFVSVYQEQKNTKLALQFGDSIKKYINEDISPYTLIGLFRSVSDNYKSAKQFDSAFFYLAKAYKLSDTLYKSELTTTIADMQTKYDFTQKEKEIEVLNEKDKKKEVILYFVVVIGIIILFSGTYIYYVSRQRKKINRLLEIKNHEISAQKQKVEEHQKEIVDSIRYAQRIQQSLMPTEKYIERNLKNIK